MTKPNSNLKKNNLINNYILVITSIILTIYILEGLLILKNQKNNEKNYKTEFLKNLKKKHQRVYPIEGTRELITKEGKLHNLGDISNSVTIFNNENGYYPIIMMDEHGFNNPKSLYQKKIDILLIGDSYAEGYSVEPENNIGSLLRNKNFNVINLGKGGNGPLKELGTLVEYGKNIKPKIIFWLYSHNDLTNLKNEAKSKILMKYLNDDNFSQNLINKQNILDSAMIKLVKDNQEKKFVIKNQLISFINLNKSRNLILRNFREKNQIDLFEKVMIKSKKLISDWDGKLYFIYLPSYERYIMGKKDTHKEEIKNIIRSINLDFIDIEKEILRKNKNINIFFPNTNKVNEHGYHFTTNGYKEITEIITEVLN